MKDGEEQLLTGAELDKLTVKLLQKAQESTNDWREALEIRLAIEDVIHRKRLRALELYQLGLIKKGVTLKALGLSNWQVQVWEDEYGG
jgi:hypothetical protein